MSQELQPGTRLSGGSYGGYTIDSVLGRGGFGITYSARSEIGIQFAIKEFFPKNTCERDTLSNQIIVTDFSKIELIGRLRQRFLEEADNIANCDHPYVVHVVESFEENGTAYMVMEHVEGVTLQTCVKNNGPMDEETAKEIIIKLALALNYVHNRKITHLDVKPDNIILTASGEPVLIDFGLSRQHKESTTTQEGLITAISKGYTAAEQYSRRLSNAFHPESDVYSLAATYFYLISGNRPVEPHQGHDYGKDLPNSISEVSRNCITTAMQYASAQRTPNMTTFIGNLRGKIPIKNVVEVHVENNKPSAIFWNTLLIFIIAVWLFYLYKYVTGANTFLTSNYYHGANIEELIVALGANSIFAFLGLIIPNRGFKIVISIITTILAILFIANFEIG